MTDLSDTAKAVAGAWFPLMKTEGRSELRFGMREYRPTVQAQAGLDELVAAGYLRRITEPTGAIVYKPLRSCFEFLKWLSDNEHNPSAKFKLIEKIDD